MEGIRIRHAEPSDYQYVISVIDDWWGGRKMADMLPMLFFEGIPVTENYDRQGEDRVLFVKKFET